MSHHNLYYRFELSLDSIFLLQTQDDHTREKLQQLVYYVSNRSRGGPRGGVDHMMRM
jgi:hypothetical protein